MQSCLCLQLSGEQLVEPGRVSETRLALRPSPRSRSAFKKADEASFAACIYAGCRLSQQTPPWRPQNPLLNGTFCILCTPGHRWWNKCCDYTLFIVYSRVHIYVGREKVAIYSSLRTKLIESKDKGGMDERGQFLRVRHFKVSQRSQPVLLQENQIKQIPTKYSQAESTKYLVLTLVSILCIVGVLLASTVVYCLRHRSHHKLKEKLTTLGTDTAGDATATYQVGGATAR